MAGGDGPVEAFVAPVPAGQLDQPLSGRRVGDYEPAQLATAAAATLAEFRDSVAFELAKRWLSSRWIRPSRADAAISTLAACSKTTGDEVKPAPPARWVCLGFRVRGSSATSSPVVVVT